MELLPFVLARLDAQSETMIHVKAEGFLTDFYRPGVIRLDRRDDHQLLHPRLVSDRQLRSIEYGDARCSLVVWVGVSEFLELNFEWLLVHPACCRRLSSICRLTSSTATSASRIRPIPRFQPSSRPVISPREPS